MSETTWNSFERLADLAITYGINLVGAVALLVAGWIAAAWADRTVRRLAARSEHVDPTLKPLLGSLVRYGILLFVITAALARFGI